MTERTQPTEMGTTITAEPPTVNGFWLYVIEEDRRVARGQWVRYHRCEIHQAGQLVTITRRVASRSQALADGTAAALELSAQP